MTKPAFPAITEFERELANARDQSITNLRQASDHRRVELLARNIHAILQGESRADAALALTKALAIGFRGAEQVTSIAIIVHLLTQEILGDDA